MGVTKQLRREDAETQSLILGRPGQPQRRREGTIVGAREVEDTMRTGPTEVTKQGS